MQSRLPLLRAARASALLVVGAALTIGLTQCSSSNSTSSMAPPIPPTVTVIPDQDAVSVTTYHYDNARSGIQANEKTLTPVNVNATTFGKQFSVPTDGLVTAQPLIATSITMSDGQPHTLLLVATENDSVYAYDADNTSGKLYWQVSLLQAGETAVPGSVVGSTDILPVIGIVGTPVLDLTRGVMYLVAKSKTSSGSYVQRLHALSLQTGGELLNGPTLIQAQLPGTSSDAANGIVSFNPLKQLQRPALGLDNGTVWIGWASHGDNQPYHGWLIGYNSSDISKQTAVFNDTPNGSEGGIWMSSGGPAFDSAGNIYLNTGNGDFDAASGNYSSSAVRLTPGSGPNGSMVVADYFTPFNQANLSIVDADFGVSSSLLLPDQTGPVKHLLVTADKDSDIFLINRDNMGKYNATDNNVVQMFSSSPQHIKQNELFFNNTLYVSGDNVPMNAFAFNPVTQQFSTTPSSSTVKAFACDCYVGGTSPTVSANGSNSAILWTIDNTAIATPGPAVLRAYNPADLSQELYDTTQAAANRDQAFNGVKFTSPVVANGHVYVGGINGVTVYGLLAP